MTLSKVAIHPHTQFPRDHIHFHAYVLPEPSCCMVAANGLGAELLSQCGVVSAWTEDLHPCFFFFLKIYFYYFFIGKADVQRGETERKILHPMIHSPSERNEPMLC